MPARNKTSGQFEDKTANIVSLNFDGRQYKVRFRDARYPLTYNAANILVCKSVGFQDIADALVEVRGTPWAAAKRLEFFSTAAGPWTRVHYDTPSRGQPSGLAPTPRFDTPRTPASSRGPSNS